MSLIEKPKNALELFYSYAHNDERWRKRLETHLSNLQRQGFITQWHDRNISAGVSWANEIDAHLNSAHIILFLISPDFIASDYCGSFEMKRALERHKAGEARVIPVILRSTDWNGTAFEHLQALPKDAKPLTQWKDRDDALLHVTREIGKVVKELNASFSVSHRKLDTSKGYESAVSMAKKKHIFMSYHGFEAEFALKLAADLKSAGIWLWMDRLDGIVNDEAWRDTIQQAIHDCAAMVMVISPSYVESEYCKKEMALANTLKLPIFPVLLNPVEERSLPSLLQRIQFEDFTHWREDNIYRKRLENVVSRLKAETPELVGDIPDDEVRYLIGLVAEIESRQGVLEYVDLSGETDALADIRRKPFLDDEWGFALLLEQDTTFNEPIQLRKIALKDLAEAVEKHPRFVLIGDPGAGKTTTLRRLALNAARTRLENPRTAPLPLLLYLSQWEEDVEFIDFVCSKWPFKIDIAGLLQTGEVLLYLDGLNEMGVNRIYKAKLLSNWLESVDAPRCVIITCRTDDYINELKFKSLPTIQAEHLDISQILQFATNYLGERAEDFLKLIRQDSQEQSGDVRSLWRLARNPYMLSALIYLYKESSRRTLPRNTGTLFRSLARALWEREKLRSTPGWIPFEEAEAMFARLAFEMIDEGLGIDISLAYAIKKLGSKSLLWAGTNANYITINDNRVKFFHELMQDYFAAVRLSHSGLVGKLKYLEIYDGAFPGMGLSTSHATVRVSQRWDWPIVALCGMNKDMINEVSALDPLLAIECIKGGEKRMDRSPLIKELFALLNSGERAVRIHVVKALGELRDEQTIPTLIELLKNDNSVNTSKSQYELYNDIEDYRSCFLSETSVAYHAAGALRQIGIPEALAAVEQWQEALVEMLTDEVEDIRAGAALSLKFLGITRTIPELLGALHDDNRSMRMAAVEALGKIDDSKAMLGLFEALKDASYYVRITAVRALGKIGNGEAVTGLINFLSVGDDFVCHYASDELEAIGTPEAKAAVEARWQNLSKQS
jgi:TIR domain/HEAT repeats/NACHT domain